MLCLHAYPSESKNWSLQNKSEWSSVMLAGIKTLEECSGHSRRRLLHYLGLWPSVLYIKINSCSLKGTI
jgi:hypothetical protein